MELGGGIACDPWANNAEARIYLVEHHGDQALHNADGHGVAEEMKRAIGLRTRPGDTMSVSMGSSGF